MNMIIKDVKDSLVLEWEEAAFYQSGLSAHGCLENLDEYTKQAIQTYGRYMLKYFREHIEYNKL